MREKWELVGVPYTSMKEPGGIADAIGVLRERGLAQRLAALGVDDGGDLELDGPDGERGPSGLLNESALSTLVMRTHQRVAKLLEGGRRPLLVGGDCPVLLGALAGVRDRDGSSGLVMLDGHEDAWPPPLSDTGEGSDSEIAIALGRVAKLPASIAALTPLLNPEELLMVGPRDHAEIAAGGIPSLGDEAGLFLAGDVVSADPGGAERTLAAALEGAAPAGLWLHIDLDVLSSGAFAAVDYPQAGGIELGQLASLARRALDDERCRGASVVIYNPDLDPEGVYADSVVELACGLVDPAPLANA